MHGMKNGYTGLRIRGVSMEKDEPVVVLEDQATDRRFRIPVGPFEATAIILEMEGIRPPRPLTHDLLALFFAEGGFSLDRVELFGEPGPGARARFSYRKGLRRYEKEVRPADALALALRLDAPVLAESAMFAGEEGGRASWRRTKIVALEEWKAQA